jgi:AhpD family alkylhydroperoxidase
METRIKSPVFTLPGARDALQAITRATEGCGVPRATLELMHLRASQINGCGRCVDWHARVLRKLGERGERIWAVSGWRETAYYSDAERAALALTEAASRLSDRVDPVPDELWQEAARHYDPTQLAALVMSIGLVNLWNRVNVVTGQMGGEHLEQFL